MSLGVSGARQATSGSPNAGTIVRMSSAVAPRPCMRTIAAFARTSEAPASKTGCATPGISIISDMSPLPLQFFEIVLTEFGDFRRNHSTAVGLAAIVRKILLVIIFRLIKSFERRNLGQI